MITELTAPEVLENQRKYRQQLKKNKKKSRAVNKFRRKKKTETKKQYFEAQKASAKRFHSRAAAKAKASAKLHGWHKQQEPSECVSYSPEQIEKLNRAEK
jgi:hypothetical protein